MGRVAADDVDLRFASRTHSAGQIETSVGVLEASEGKINDISDPKAEGQTLMYIF